MTLLACRFAERRAVRTGLTNTGWTLVELMLGLAIAGLLVILALPFYGEWIADYQVLNHAQLLAGTMNIARAEAVKRGRRVNLCKSADRVQCESRGRLGRGLRGPRRLGSRRRRRRRRYRVSRRKGRPHRGSRSAATVPSMTMCRTQVSARRGC